MSQFFVSGGQSIGSFSFSTSPSNEYSGLIFFRMDWFDLLAAISQYYFHSLTFLVVQLVKNPPAMQETLVLFLGWEDPLKKG